MPLTKNQNKTSLLSFFIRNQKSQFVSEIDYVTNRGRQAHKAIETLVQLRELDVEEEDQLKIAFTFHSDSTKKTEQLAAELEILKYSIHKIADSSDKMLMEISGETTPLLMMHEVLKKWALEMCELGYKHDCGFATWDVILLK